MIKDLEKTHPHVFAFIDSVQPYNLTYDWMEHFSKFANEKHIRLTPQKRVESKTLSFGYGGARIEMGEGTSISFGGKIIRGGQTIDVNSDKIYSDPNIDVKKEVWVSFNLGDSNINAIWLCKKVVEDGEKIINNFLRIF